MAEEGGGKAHPLLYVITTLLAINLVATLWLTTTNLQERQSPTTVGGELPEILTAAERDRMFQEFRTNYNAKNYDALFEMFHKAVQIGLNRENTMAAIIGLRQQFGLIKEGVYANYQYLGKQGQYDTFKLHYAVKLGNEGDRSGRVMIDVIFDGEHYGIQSFFIGG